MEAFKALTSTTIPLDRANVDTDQIIPAEYLKRIERTGFGEFLFKSLRDSDPDFVFNDVRYSGSQILVSGPNFGSGSSREHAPWALEDYGIRAVIAPSFADIFQNNCVNVGIVTVELDADIVAMLIDRAKIDPESEITVDLERCDVIVGDDKYPFEVDGHARQRLLEGLDHVALTLDREHHIANYEDSTVHGPR